MAFEEVEPFGESVADQRHGILSSVLANVNRDAKKKPEPYRAEDFIYWHPSHWPENKRSLVPQTTPESQSELIKQSIFKGLTFFK
jgi:flagellar basal body rod protein FlgC